MFHVSVHSRSIRPSADEQERAQVAELQERAQVQEATEQNVTLAFVDQGYTGDVPAEAAAA